MVPGWGTKIPHVAQCMAKKREREREREILHRNADSKIQKVVGNFPDN